MREYVRERCATLLRRLAFRINRAAKLHDADSIHDLRVAIRRFEQCLRTFDAFFHGSHKKKIRRRLKKIMSLCGEIRNRDIAQALLKDAGVAGGSSISSKLSRERKQAQHELIDMLDRWNKRDLSRKWSARLGL
jgi:CHAD domain-containing protein